MKILVIDDDLTVCKSCQKIIQKAGHEVAYSLSGHEALRMMEDIAYDIVFTDLKMAEMGGMEVLRFIKDRDPDVVVVIRLCHGRIRCRNNEGWGLRLPPKTIYTC